MYIFNPENIFSFLLPLNEFLTFPWEPDILGNLIFNQIFLLLTDYLLLIFHLLIAFYFMRAIWISIPRKHLIILLSLTIINILLPIILMVSHFIGFYYNIDIWDVAWSLNHIPFIGDILVNIFVIFLTTEPVQYLMLLYVYFYLGIRMYKSIKIPLPNERILRAVVLWRLIFILLFTFYIGSVLFGFFYIGTVFGFFFFSISADSSLMILVRTLSFSFIMLFFIILCLLAYLSIKYPEGQLIFEAQLYRAKILYDTFDQKKQQKLKSSVTFRHIADYIEQIPPELYEEISGS